MNVKAGLALFAKTGSLIVQEQRPLPPEFSGVWSRDDWSGLWLPWKRPDVWGTDAMWFLNRRHFEPRSNLFEQEYSIEWRDGTGHPYEPNR